MLGGNLRRRHAELAEHRFAGHTDAPAAVWRDLAVPVASPDSLTVSPGVPVPSMRSTAVRASPSAGLVITGAARPETSIENEAFPDRLNPFLVSAENRRVPSVGGAGKDQFPEASTGTSSGAAAGSPDMVTRTVEFAATAEAGAAGTRPVTGWPAVTAWPGGVTSSGLFRNSWSSTPPESGRASPPRLSRWRSSRWNPRRHPRNGSPPQSCR